MKNILFILYFFTVQQCVAQLNLDSLWKVYNNTEEADSSRLMAMWFIAYDGYLYNDPDSSYILAQEMYDFAKKTGELQFQGFALGTQGAACYYLGKLDLAIDCHEKALKIHEKLKNHGSAASSYNNIANIYRERGQQAKAIDYFMKALKTYEKMDHKAAISTVLGNLGAVYADMGDIENSRFWYQKALHVKKQTDDELGLSLLLAGIGARYLNEGVYDSAMYYQREGLEIRRSINNKNGIAHSLNHIGQIHLAMHDLDSAMFYFMESLKLFEKLKMASGISDACTNIADVYKRQGQTQKAMSFAKRALEAAKQSESLDAQRDVSFMLYDLYKNTGNFRSALEMYETHILTRDSMFKMENKSAILKQKFQYDYEKKSLADNVKREEEKKLQDLKHEKETQQKETIILAVVVGLVLVVAFLVFVFHRLKITKRQKLVIEEQKEKVELAHSELEEKNTEILASITYAKRIQSAILPPDKVVKEYLQKSFVLYKPKDIVAGDFYWMQHQDNKILFAAADCTGHGVPGAMVSVVCNNALNRSVKEFGLTDPGQILDKTREIVIEEFEKSNEDVKDGMDIALCSLEGNTLQYAGANNPLWIIRNGEVLETKANKQPIGKFDHQEAYTTHRTELELGDTFYIFSDGYVDQFGGERGKKLMSGALKRLLLDINAKTMEEQKIFLDDYFEQWRGDHAQIDDVCMIGVRI